MHSTLRGETTFAQLLSTAGCTRAKDTSSRQHSMQYLNSPVDIHHLYYYN
ncbi:MAG: hypothetical protein ACK5Q5_04040 [Planctomycetaceae bacterium]